MPSHRLAARPPHGVSAALALRRDPDEVATYLQDAARTPGGHTPVVAFPRSEAEVAQVLREAPAVLPIGAQSSLTGGATPFGEWVLSTSRLDAMGPRKGAHVRVGAGLSLVALQTELRRERLFFPPVPTFLGAFVGGVVSTNAAGAATFKYGTTRAWVDSLTIVLANGDVLEVHRGETRAHTDGYFEIVLTSGDVRRVSVPGYRMPDVPKCSAGYFAAPEMDLVDLFIGSEGTLGIVTEAELRVAAEPPRLVGWLPLPSEAQAIEIVHRLREASLATRAAGDRDGLDICAIEMLDARSLELLREDGKDRELRVRASGDTQAAIVFQLELPADAPGEALGTDAHGPIGRLCRLLGDGGLLDGLEVSLPGDERRAEQILEVREAVPVAVNHRVAAVQRGGQAKVRKMAADMIVPFSALPEMLAAYRHQLTESGLDHAIWGHVSDGNLHVNVLPRRDEDVIAGDAAILELGREAIRLGGSPLAEHGVGRNPQKQALLAALHGDDGVAAMRRVKEALDPEGKLAPGVLFAGRPRS
jgi:D-lactate dehydrogenase (cytochrome)